MKTKIKRSALKSVPRERPIHLDALLWTNITRNIGGVYLAYLATRERLEKLEDVEWFDPQLDRYENKVRMKEHAGSYMGFLVYAKATAVLMLAKAIEDAIWLVKEETGRQLQFWKIADRLVFGAEAKEVRALANAMKHNRSIIRATDSPSSRFLTEHRGYRDGVWLDVLMLEDRGVFDIPNTICCICLFLLALAENVSGTRPSWLDLTYADQLQAVRSLVPDMLNLRDVSEPFSSHRRGPGSTGR